SGHLKVASLAAPKNLRRRSLPGEIENIFNKGYWASADGNNNLSPGQPRTFSPESHRQVMRPRGEPRAFRCAQPIHTFSHFRRAGTALRAFAHLRLLRLLRRPQNRAG